MKSPRALLQIEEREHLLRHISEHLPNASPNDTADRIEQILEETKEQIANHGKVYSATTGKPVAKEVVGGQWHINERQRRWVARTIPTRARGGQTVRWPRYLIAMLGKEYVLGTGKKPTFSTFDLKLSKFEAFAEPFLTHFKVRNQKNRIREYVEERRKPSPYNSLK